MKRLDELREEIDKCVRCGTCRSICPTFRVIGRETASARGKLTLIESYLDGEIGLSEAFIKHIKECTTCGACKQSCPRSVDTVGVFLAARAEITEKKGLPLAASMIFRNLRDTSRLMAGVLKLASRFQSLVFRDSSVEKGLLSRFTLPLVGDVVGQGRLLPPLAPEFFLDLPEVKALGEAGSRKSRPVRVAFYAGCGVNYLMPDVGVSTLEVLKRAGAEVVVPRTQICCGMPAFSMGDIEMARSMALRNIEAFEAIGADYITTSCATCGHGLKHMFRDLLGNTHRDKVEAFSSKVMDITELLVKVFRFKGDKDNGGIVATYHDPCHLNRAQGVRNEPRELIKGARGVEFREMSFPCSCCGLGGGLSTTNYSLSIEVTRRKIESVRNTGADTVITACPGCMVQLRDGLHKYGVKARVAHVVELL